MNPPPLEGAWHIVHGRVLPWGRARGIRFVIAPDSLELGPSSVRDARHTAIRRDFWRTYYDELGLDWPLDAPDEAIGHAQLRRGLGRSNAPVVLWAARDSGGILFIWWAVAALAGRGQAVWLVRGSQEDWLVAGGNRRRAGRLLLDATPLAPPDRRLLRSRWSAFASGAFDRLPTRLARPDWRTLPGTVSLLFPRLSGQSIPLSRFDTALLSSFEDWTRPSEAVDKRTVDVLFALGDWLIEYRARQWTRWNSPRTALESRREETGSGVLGRHSYRLTEHGHRLLAGGLASVTDAPPFAVGGAAAYAPERPWLLKEDGDAGSWTRGGS